MSFEATALLVSWVAILLMALVVSGLVRQVHALTSGRVRVRPDEIGLPEGTPAPDFARLAPAAGATTLLLFVSESCAVCEEVLDELASLAGTGRLHDLAVRAVFPAAAGDRWHPRPVNGTTEANGAAVRVLEGEVALFERYHVPATPFAVVVDGDGRVGRSEPVGSRQGLREVVERSGTQPSGTEQPAEATA